MMFNGRVERAWCSRFDPRSKWTYEFDTVSSPGGTRLATKIAVCSVFVK